jgi:hypothetical protein
MKTAALEVSYGVARTEAAKWAQGKTTEDQLIAKAYRAICRGHRVIDLYESMALAGCDDRGRPMLAIVRADATRCECYLGQRAVQYDSNKGRWPTRISVPSAFFPGLRPSEDRLESVVPIIPPPYRRYSLRKYRILWEAAWESVTKDPLLLEPLGGALYRVVAAWDLTPIEQAVLRGRRSR